MEGNTKNANVFLMVSEKFGIVKTLSLAGGTGQFDTAAFSDISCTFKRVHVQF